MASFIRGQSAPFSTFKLLIAAIIAVAILVLLLNALGFFSITPVGADPLNVAADLVRDLSERKVVLSPEKEVVFQPNTVLTAEAIAETSKAELSGKQICLSAGAFELLGADFFSVDPLRSKLEYKGDTPFRTKMRVFCDEGWKLKGDVQKYFSLAGLSASQAAECPCYSTPVLNSQICCFITLESAGTEPLSDEEKKDVVLSPECSRGWAWCDCYVPPPPQLARPVDVFFIIDASGSMREEYSSNINSVAEAVKKITAYLSQHAPTSRIGAYIFAGRTTSHPSSAPKKVDNRYLRKESLPLNNKQKKDCAARSVTRLDVGLIEFAKVGENGSGTTRLQNELSNVFPAGGCEPWGAWLKWASTDLAWSNQNDKLVVLITDEEDDLRDKFSKDYALDPQIAELLRVYDVKLLALIGWLSVDCGGISCSEIAEQQLQGLAAQLGQENVLVLRYLDSESVESAINMMFWKLQGKQPVLSDKCYANLSCGGCDTADLCKKEWEDVLRGIPSQRVVADSDNSGGIKIKMSPQECSGFMSKIGR